ncbi:MAG: hypothetical protein KDK38_13445 [Leptospiraceae bacterium]|nr:hypothetical protein [Leptospiraceae bacterium]
MIKLDSGYILPGSEAIVDNETANFIVKVGAGIIIDTIDDNKPVFEAKKKRK